MSLFVLDTIGDNELFEKEEETIQEQQFLKESINQNPKNHGKSLDDCKEESNESSEDEIEDFAGLPPPSKDISHILNKHIAEKANSDISKKKLLKVKNVLVSQSVAEIEKSKNPLKIHSTNESKKLKKIEREKSKGANWFNMKAPEITDEIENDLKILQMRSALDPKRFYKKNDLKVLPKYFQIGTVLHSPLEYHNEKHIRKNKKKTLVDELLTDTDFNKYTKRKYQEVMQKKQRYHHKKEMKKMKRLKKNKK